MHKAVDLVDGDQEPQSSMDDQKNPSNSNPQLHSLLGMPMKLGDATFS